MKKVILGILVLVFGNGLLANNIDLLKKECEDGNIDNCFVVGQIYGSGQGVKIDYEKAFKYLKKSCRWWTYTGVRSCW